MKNTTTLNFIAKSYILFSAFSLISVSIMAFMNPQSVMDLVDVQLNNNDAYSSIRGVYGGVGITIFASIIYLFRKDLILALKFLSLFWGSYMISRIITIFSEGSLGAFGTQWIITESVLFMIGIMLTVIKSRSLQSQRSGVHFA